MVSRARSICPARIWASARAVRISRSPGRAVAARPSHSEAVSKSFKRVESLVFSGKDAGRAEKAIRLAVTLATGVEHQQVIHFSAEEEQRMSTLQHRFADILAEDERLGLAAASRAIWARFEAAEEKKR